MLYVFMVFRRSGGEGRLLSGLEGDPSPMLAPVMDCPMAPHPTLWLGDGLALGLPFVCMR